MDQETQPLLRVSDHEGVSVLVTGGRERERELSGDDDGDGGSHASYEKAPVRGGAPGLRGSRIRRGGIEWK